MALAGTGAAEGAWLRAERQTAGRGRQGRGWVSPIGNLHASTLVRLRGGDPGAATLAFVAAVALEEATACYLSERAPARLKWPNDLLLGDAKLAGILLERSGDAVVIGFGVNLAHHPTDTERPAISLAACGIHVAAAVFLETLATTFARWLGCWREAGLSPVLGRWRERAHPIGTPLLARPGDGRDVRGTFDGLDTGGALILRLADGARHVIHAGDVFLV